MKSNLLLLFILVFFTSLQPHPLNLSHTQPMLHNDENPYVKVRDIPPPAGYKRIPIENNSFASWLRDISLKKDKSVHLFNGSLKMNQSAQFAVMDISVGRKDLQQCADAVMRLRAEYLYSLKNDGIIQFWDNAHTCYSCNSGCDRAYFDKYLEKVFAWCGTLSLEKQLHARHNISQIAPGDVFIKGGSPGHAVIVTDVAINKEGKRVFMIAQSYMPAQEIHILQNPLNSGLSPWYPADLDQIITPEWEFKSSQLKTW